MFGLNELCEKFLKKGRARNEPFKSLERTDDNKQNNCTVQVYRVEESSTRSGEKLFTWE